MSNSLATYSFLPWLRKGLANSITGTVNPGDPAHRASVTVRLAVSPVGTGGENMDEESITRDIMLYGPGDIIGINKKVIVKTEPQNRVTNFEPNYLPYIDFYEEDFPWRYTPARNDSDRLTPWLTLVVLKDDEFEDGAVSRNKPLPFFRMKDGTSAAAIFPLPSQLWAWAHVHINTDLSGGAAPDEFDHGQIKDDLTEVTDGNPDIAYSRIICPRKLEPSSGYHAFLIPTFESGRLAGLGRPVPGSTPATQCGWEEDSATAFPYYHRWYFRTSNIGNFEYLVNLLEPRPANKELGVRDMDVMNPGSNLPAIDDQELGGILKLGGALRVPFDTMAEADKAEVRKYDRWNVPYPHKFTRSMARRINLADEYSRTGKETGEINSEAGITTAEDAGHPDPVITSPLYGRWHALQQRLLKDRDNSDLPDSKNWVHELNLDPRYRVAAGLGTRVIQTNQEEYMHAAWKQVGDIVEANSKLRFGQMAKEVSARFYGKHIALLDSEKAFSFTAPVHKRIIYKDLTTHKQVEESTVPPALVSPVFRRIVRPGSRMMRKVGFTSAVRPDNLIERVNDGQVTAAPPKADPEGGINLAGVARDARPADMPEFFEKFLIKYRWFKYVPLALLILLVILLLIFNVPLDSPVAGFVLLILAGAYLRFRTWEKESEKADNLPQENQTAEAVDNYPFSPDFRIVTPGTDFEPAKGATDSVEARKFKDALKDAYTLVSVSIPERERKKLELAPLARHIIRSVDPAVTIPKRVFTSVRIPPWIRDNMVEKFTPVMVHPEIDLPMYKPLADLSSEFFLPNIGTIEQNSIILLENNQKFIEAYMTGINHEMSRELLWRQYPTDLRGTCFRQFWDVSSFLPAEPGGAASVEELRDIPPIHKWNKTASAAAPDRNKLGSNNQRARSDGKSQLVLVIRGELLEKYPTAVIYAQKAGWGVNSDDEMDVKANRVLVDPGGPNDAVLSADKVKTPIFEARLDPDIYFFGFDLDSSEALGTPQPTSTSDDPGWFFVIKERPGEPRFGLSVGRPENQAGEQKLINWNNLSWPDTGTPAGRCIELGDDIDFDEHDPGNDVANRPVADDVQARWGKDSNSAGLAYILYQVPVMVGVHASRLLSENN